ncbi:MAG: hypothetical protein BVN35_20340 [Proteobacteria bacterium ST_bin11]|nr:MAG: hypothetical protein BVN35_20340 [Proteobacteria bacterium ST_bin11]
MLTNDEINEKVSAVMQHIAGLSIHDTLRVLHVVEGQVLNEIELKQEPAMAKPLVAAISRFKPRLMGTPSKFEKDREMADYVLSIQEGTPYVTIHEMCVKKFGEARAPSKSAIHRYIQSITKRIQQDN